MTQGKIPAFIRKYWAKRKNLSIPSVVLPRFKQS